MKKSLLLFSLLILVFASCKKDQTSSQSSLSTTDASGISATLKIWHGTNIKGTSPAGTNNGSLVLDSTSQNIQSYKGGYAVIMPSVLSGTIAGYYVHVDGADSYFKVDYSSALLHRPALLGLQHKRAGLFLRPADDSSSYSDSAIVIQLPDNIAPGTFCMEYWAYDANGYTSNEVSECVTVEQLGSSDATSFTGNWRVTGLKFDSVDNFGGDYVDTAWHYNMSDSTNVEDYTTSYYCVDGYLSNQSGSYYDPISYNDVTGTSSEQATIPNYFWYKNSNLAIAANGAWTFNGETVSKRFNGDLYSQLLPCSNISFPENYQRDDETDSEIGGWSYNATTNEFIIVEKETGDSGEETFVEKFHVANKTANSFTLLDEGFDGGSLILTK
ncbi:MAG: hypothetical protein WDM71_07960 [Ferruginibacter sp.]